MPAGAAEPLGRSVPALEGLAPRLGGADPEVVAVSIDRGGAGADAGYGVLKACATPPDRSARALGPRPATENL